MYLPNGSLNLVQFITTTIGIGQMIGGGAPGAEVEEGADLELSKRLSGTNAIIEQDISDKVCAIAWPVEL
ncbi:hypothetical protein U9M48_013929 [Paspalum notatum var. saurae]|uniref:Uncharacterized protein n=1 Tax=Paspalum notatum var. saurae TaxID=547442 RepID=A0AAQ3WK78_PASNO